MKKLIALLISAVLICTAIPAFAYDKEILFRNIPWKTSYEECMELGFNTSHDFANPKNRGINGTIFSIYTMACSYGVPLVPPHEFYDGYRKTTFSMSCIFNDNIVVAGYNVSSIDADFILPSSSKLGVNSHKDGIFYSAQYKFETKNKDTAAMYASLKSKLTDLYGQPSNFTTKTDDHKTAAWYGTNNTCAILSLGYPSDSTLYLCYGLLNVVDMVKDIEAERAYKTQYDGL